MRVSPKKQLGQHFLINEKIAKKIVNSFIKIPNSTSQYNSAKNNTNPNWMTYLAILVIYLEDIAHSRISLEVLQVDEVKYVRGKTYVFR